MDGPVLEGHFSVKVPHWLIKEHHDCFDEETTRPAEGVPKVELSGPLGLGEDARLQDAGGSERLLEDTPAHEWLVAVLVQVLVRCAQQHFPSVLYNVDLDFAELFETLHEVFLGLKLSAHLLKALDSLLRSLSSILCFTKLLLGKGLDFFLFLRYLLLEPLLLKLFAI